MSVKSFWSKHKVNIIGWGVVLLFVAGITVLTVSSQQDQARKLQETIVVRDSDHVKGPQTAKVTLFVFGDFQCPACASFAPIVEQLAVNNPENLKIVFRHLPLTSIHQNAVAAAIAAEAAAAQDKFWEMHDLLYLNQTEWSTLDDPNPKFVEYATQLKLDTQKFATSLADPAIAGTVETQTQEAAALGISSTPTFYVNGAEVNINQVDDLQKAIDAALK